MTGLLLISVVPAYPQSDKDEIPGIKTQLVEKLTLTDTQVIELEKILAMTVSQAETDRVNFKGNAVGLAQSALRRRDTCDSLIEQLLTTEQNEMWDMFKNKRKQDEQFYILKEGLLLTKEQCAKIKAILDEFRKPQNRKSGNQSGGMQEGGEPPEGGMPGGGGMMGGMPGGGMPGGGGGMMGGGGMRGPRGDSNGKMNKDKMEERMLEKFKEQEEKIAKKISPLLTPDQKKMYSDLKGLIEQEFKSRMQERMMNRPENDPREGRENTNSNQ